MFAVLVEMLRLAHVRRGVPLRAGEAVDLEVAVRVGAARRVQRAIAATVPSLSRSARRAERAAQRATRMATSVLSLRQRTVAVSGRSVPVSEAAVIASAAPNGTRHRDRDGVLLRLLGVLLLLVDVAALIIVIGFLVNVDWAAPSPADLVTVVALAVFGGAVQAMLAVRLGKLLWARRHSDPDVEEYPRRGAVVVPLAGLLGLLAALAAAALLVRVDVEAQLAQAGTLGTAVGLLLAGSALAAPWCVVAQEAYRESPEAALVRACARAVVRTDRAACRRLAFGRWCLDTAVRRERGYRARYTRLRARLHAEYLRAEEAVRIARGLVDPQLVHARDDEAFPLPDVPELDEPARDVADAIRTARAALAFAAGDVREDHDLAG
ncbi:hypothetical protein PSU4_22250 [Pseudonocardia sulfidoxydans NBRC 16205]|uniref:Uncharacterized protein n=1 Tax=Pseudonocardia sulfidoxydans NBRC 16205 TaxID=1223511 RepID=A0A511DES0_9PSEU|nr:hypothetical protein PSU4_22250 [Pseudonocardia sulfidoxydans NBRC 16205]